MLMTYAGFTNRLVRLSPAPYIQLSATPTSQHSIKHVYMVLVVYQYFGVFGGQ